MSRFQGSWNKAIANMDILETIVAQKRIEVAALQCDLPTPEGLVAAIKARGGVRDFSGALRRASQGSVGLIAEVKKASPSKGVIRPDFDPVQIAREYAQSGAHCLSVLTDEKFFQGSLTFLRDIRQAVNLPLLRKDFIIDPRQILQAIEWGADAILLIVAILDDRQLRDYHDLARAAGLSVLVEVHDENELKRALASGAELIGVNNRNLKTFDVDLATTEKLASLLRASDHGAEKLLVAESGIHTRADVQRLIACGANAILVGESLMRQSDLRSKVAELLGR
jgi:indole-3-glycerol phosphate synthase